MSSFQGSTLSGQRDQSRDLKQEPSNRSTNTKVMNAKLGVKDKSFAHQMAALNTKTHGTRTSQKSLEQKFDPSIDLTKEEFSKLPDDLKSLYIKERQKKAQRQERISSNNQETASDETQSLEQSQKKLGQQLQENQRATLESQAKDAAQIQEIDEDSIYESKQESIAQAAQDKQEQVNQAAGNAQKQQEQSAEEQRKQQLANWEILAPRILEDGKNKAIRLDIPDVEDIKTIIVKMRGNSVDIQAIGSKDLVKIFKTKEGILRSTLAKKNLKMGSARVLDAAAIYGA